MPGSTADWAATVPWKGIQNMPEPIAAIASIRPVPGTVTIPQAKLTPAGSDGSITFSNGVLVAYSKPT